MPEVQDDMPIHNSMPNPHNSMPNPHNSMPNPHNSMPNPHIFRSYDIRGLVGTDLDEQIMEKIGQSLGEHIKKDLVLAYDVRLHSPPLKDAFLRGFLLSGNNVEDCGLLSMGAGMFHAWQSGKEYAYVTASHLTKEWNGVKFFHGTGLGFLEEENQKVRNLFFSVLPQQSRGILSKRENTQLLENYRRFLLKKVKLLRSLNIVLDCGHGCAGLLAPQLFKELGCHVKTLFGELDGTFPSHLPDPIEKELGLLKKETVGHDIGIAYDGDADRTALIDDTGKFLLPEETSYIILSELLKTEKGPVIANVECTRILDIISSKFDRPVIRVPVGHTFLMDAVNKHSAAFGVESAGHYVLPSIIPFDDALVIGLYMASILSKREEKLSALCKDIPKAHFERLSFRCPDHIKFEIMKKLIAELTRDFANANTMDGIRIDLENGWALLRVSNTAPVIRLTIEGSTESDKKELQKIFLSYVKEEFQAYDLGMIPEH